MSAEILIVDDEADIRNLVQGILEDEGYVTREARNSDEAYGSIESAMPSLVVLDIWLQGSAEDGLAILKNVKARYPFLPVVMISGHGTIETAVAAIKDGAYDFIEKPFKSDRLLLMIQRALENARLLRENAALKKQATVHAAALIGQSPQILQIQQILERVAPTNSRVLLSGEPGTGKDIVARLIHKHSARAAEPYVVMNCATLHPERFESELFGLEGSGASDKTGLLEQAHGGTLLLDEISDMPLETQGKIVRVLQEQKFTKIGGAKSLEVDVRVLATTNRNLEGLMEEGRFRQDLYYRLNVVPLTMPALRDRPQDIAALADFFLGSLLKQSAQVPRSFDVSVYAAFRAYKWPGNIRQLRNVVEWMVIMHGGSDSEIFTQEHLPPELHSSQNAVNDVDVRDRFRFADADVYSDLPLRDAREAFEREYLLAQVKRFEGNISRTAQFVGMERSALHRKLKSLHIGGERDESYEIAENPETPKKRAFS